MNKDNIKINQIYLGDCLDYIRNMKDNSIDLLIADPPYFRVMREDFKRKRYEWDNWESFDVYQDFIESCFKEFNRILRNNGSFYCFADDKIAAYVQVIGDKYFHLVNNIVWYKPNNLPIKGWANLRSYAPVTERLLFYSCEIEKSGLQEIYEDKSCFTGIKQYMRDEREKLMKERGFKTYKEFNEYINKVTNTKSVVGRHYFSNSQWVFPTEDLYRKLQTTGFFQRPYRTLNEQYKGLREEYEELRLEYEKMRRPFNQDQNYTDVWTFPITSRQERWGHPTQKPLALIERIINVSSRERALVFDPFLGSGTTAIACINTGRNYIGIEKDPEYFKIAEKRIKEAETQTRWR